MRRVLFDPNSPDQSIRLVANVVSALSDLGCVNEMAFNRRACWEKRLLVHDHHQISTSTSALSPRLL